MTKAQKRQAEKQIERIRRQAHTCSSFTFPLGWKLAKMAKGRTGAKLATEEQEARLKAVIAATTARDATGMVILHK